MGYRESQDGRKGSGGLSAECRGYELRDRDGEKVGKVDEVFVDENDRTEYLGVKMGLLGGKLTLIPADLASADDGRRLVELSESKDRIKDAPALGTNEEITDEREREVRDHFGLGSGESSETGDRGGSSPGYREDSRDTNPRDQAESRGGSATSDSSDSSDISGGTSEEREPWVASESAAGTASNRSGETAGYEAAGREETGREDAAGRGGTRGDTSGDSTSRESVRVSVWREKARAERVVGDDGSQEVRIRKEWVEEEETVEVEDSVDVRRGDEGRG